MWSHGTNHLGYQLPHWISPHGEELVPGFDEGKAEFTFPGTVVEKGETVTRKVINSYGDFITDFYGKPDTDISDDEHIAFLLYWLNKFIFCSASQAITKERLPLAWVCRKDGR